jgi:flavin-dependent dehydrogenase
MWGSGSRFDVLEKFFSLKKGRVPYAKRSGVIPLGPPKTYFDRVLLVGDAASQVKPWSGGGLVYAMRCAQIAAGVLTNADDFSESSLRAYELKWKKSVGKQIAAGMAMRKLYKHMSNSQVDKFIATARFLKILNKLDMDLL